MMPIWSCQIRSLPSRTFKNFFFTFFTVDTLRLGALIIAHNYYHALLSFIWSFKLAVRNFEMEIVYLQLKKEVRFLVTPILIELDGRLRTHRTRVAHRNRGRLCIWAVYCCFHSQQRVFVISTFLLFLTTIPVFTWQWADQTRVDETGNGHGKGE